MAAIKSTGERRRRPEEVKSRIMAAACAIFSQNGFDGATTRAIARRAGVKLPLLLYHFKTKEGLWKAAVADILDPYVARLKAIKTEMAGHSSADILRATIAEMVRHYARRPELHRIMTGEGHRKTRRLLWLCETYVDELFASLCQLIVAGQREGTVRALPPERLRYAIINIGAVQFSMRFEYERFTKRDPFSAKEQAATIDFINSLVFVDKPPRKRR